jgi:hypothetical protein
MSVAIALTTSDKAARRAALCCAAVIAAYLAIITAAATRVSWYATPVLPFLAVVTALAAQRFLSGERGRWPPPQLRGPLATGLAAIVVLALVARNARIEAAAPTLRETRAASYIRSELARIDRRRPVRIAAEGHGPILGTPYAGQETFYATAARFDGRDVIVVLGAYVAKPGEVVIACRETATSPSCETLDTATAAYATERRNTQ